MELVVQLVLAVAVFGVTLSGGSLMWPRITSSPRPQLLQEVHDSVIKTPQGAAAAQVLGVTDDKTVTPINLGQIATNAWNGIKSAAQKRAQTIVMSQVTQQLNNQYQKLPKDQQKTLQEIICKTATASAPPVIK
jgi:hypothetical protein